MKTAFISDQHFGVRGNSPIFFENFSKFYSKTFFPTLKRLKIKRVVVLGDFWEVRAGAGWRAVKEAREQFFDPLEAMGVEVIMIYGNHDVSFRNTNDTNGIDFLEPLYKNVRVIRDHAVIDIGVKFGLISWINRENLESSLEWMSTVDCQYLGGHFEINDFEMTKGQVATHGFERSIFKRFEHVYSGHFHVRGTIGNITYLSNPSQTNWGDMGLEKGFHIFDSETGEMEPVNNPFEMFKQATWGDDGLTPAFFDGVYGRLVVPNFAEVKRAELDMFLQAAREVALNMYTIEDEIKADGIAIRADEVTTTAAIIDGYIQDAYGEKDGVDVGRLKRDFDLLYSEASSKLEIE